MRPLIENLLRNAPTLLDGSMATMLQTRGLAPGESAAAWNLSRPRDVHAVCQAHWRAGARIVLTNTFDANAAALARHGLEKQAEKINWAGVLIARLAVSEQPSGEAAPIEPALIFGSVGPCGSDPGAGDFDESLARAAFEQQVRYLADAGVDGIALETFSDLREIRLALAAARNTSLPVAACMTFQSGPGADRTLAGVSPEEAAGALAAAGADIVGANCGMGIAAAISLCRRLRRACQLPLWIKPNAGLPQWEGMRPTYACAPRDFAAHAPALVDAGAAFIGGCCGTTPEFIRAIRDALDGLSDGKAAD